MKKGWVGVRLLQTTHKVGRRDDMGGSEWGRLKMEQEI